MRLAGHPKPTDHLRPASQPLHERRFLPLGAGLVAGRIGELRDRLPPDQIAEEALAVRNGLPHPDQAQIEADSDRDRWFTAQEAMDYGFIDKVITGAAQVPEGAGTLS